jgi:hypothetical protein
LAEAASTWGELMVRGQRTGLARLVVGYGAIVCAVPYLVLKVIWLAGGQLGVADAAMMRDSTMVALNTLTAFMDLVAIAIVLAFTHQWGLRIPAWLVLPPVWVGTGLLSKFVAGVPVAVIAQAFAGESSRAPLSGPVHSWVYAVVYAGFTGMGIGLTLAFVLYAQARWRAVFSAETRALRIEATHAVAVPVASAAALMAAAVGALHLAWAFGATVGLGADFAAHRTLSSSLLNAIDAAIAIGAAVGILVMVYGLGRRIPFWAALTATWVGSGSLFAWGLWLLINVLGNSALTRDRPPEMALFNLVSLLRLVAGLVIGLVCLFMLAERHHEGQARGEA